MAELERDDVDNLYMNTNNSAELYKQMNPDLSTEQFSPTLPPKIKARRPSDEERFGIQESTKTSKKPQPKPRVSVQKKLPSVSDKHEEATLQHIIEEPAAKPIPAPRAIAKPPAVQSTKATNCTHTAVYDIDHEQNHDDIYDVPSYPVFTPVAVSSTNSVSLDPAYVNASISVSRGALPTVTSDPLLNVTNVSENVKSTSLSSVPRENSGNSFDSDLYFSDMSRSLSITGVTATETEDDTYEVLDSEARQNDINEQLERSNSTLRRISGIVDGSTAPPPLPPVGPQRGVSAVGNEYIEEPRSSVVSHRSVSSIHDSTPLATGRGSAQKQDSTTITTHEHPLSRNDVTEEIYNEIEDDTDEAYVNMQHSNIKKHIDNKNKCKPVENQKVLEPANEDIVIHDSVAVIERLPSHDSDIYSPIWAMREGVGPEVCPPPVHPLPPPMLVPSSMPANSSVATSTQTSVPIRTAPVPPLDPIPAPPPDPTPPMNSLTQQHKRNSSTDLMAFSSDSVSPTVDNDDATYTSYPAPDFAPPPLPNLTEPIVSSSSTSQPDISHLLNSSRDSTVSSVFDDFASSRAVGVGGVSDGGPVYSTPHKSTKAAISSVSSSGTSDAVNNSETGKFTRRLPPQPPPKGLYYKDSIRQTCTFDDSASKVSTVWESDDTLSDGGDFFENASFLKRMTKRLSDAIPIVPAEPNRIIDRKGYLYKYASTHSRRRGWKKRWVVFNGEFLRYFSNQKSVISKRIIPISTLVNVAHDIKPNDQHMYRFQLSSVDRVYTFACENADDLSLWTSVLMRAIMSQTEPFQEGGDMAFPDNQGSVRMEGVRGNRYLAVKKDKFAYYNTQADFKAGCPIHVIDMSLASVKELSRTQLQLRTNYASYSFTFESNKLLMEWKETFEQAIAEGLGDDAVLKEVQENHSNQFCADCGAPDPHWASINLGITLCKHCAGIHRTIGQPLSKIRSLRMDQKVWTPMVIQLLQKIGNDNANNFWEWNATVNDKIDSDAETENRKEYIFAKYCQRAFCRYHPLKAEDKSLNEALCKAAMNDDILDVMQLLYSGAEILYKCQVQNDTAIEIARKYRQSLIVEFLQQNGGDDPGNQLSSSWQQHSMTIKLQTHKGYLLKMGVINKDYQRRWCTLEKDMLSYFESEKSNTAKDYIDKSEMLSITCFSDEKVSYGFELSTRKSNGRTYTFAAETDESRTQWVNVLCKCFSGSSIIVQPKLGSKCVDRAGFVFVREGASTEWLLRWIQVKQRNMYLYQEEEESWDEVDLRKITVLKHLTEEEGCVEVFEDGAPFVINLPNRALYFQGDMKKETDGWFSAVEKIVQQCGWSLSEQQLTADDVPVIVDKCINFIANYGMKTEGIYRLSGQHSKVTILLQSFKDNAQQVHLRLDDYQVHEVATTLKRFFRKELNDPVLTNNLYTKWLQAAGFTDSTVKMQWYKYLVSELPIVHYKTLKKVITHLACISELEGENKMTVMNLASIFGPVLMSSEKDATSMAEYSTTNKEIIVASDLIVNHQVLFEVKDEELEHELKMRNALEKIDGLIRKNPAGMSQGTDLLVSIYVVNDSEDPIMMQVGETKTADEVLKAILPKLPKSMSVAGNQLALYEIVCDKQLERPLHYDERVKDVILRWSNWATDFSKNNFICVKHNHVVERLQHVLDAQYSMFTELRYSEKKGFKKYHFEFLQCKLSYQKDTKISNPIKCWNIEDLTLYVGIEAKRSPPTKYGFTFISNEDERIEKTRDSPFFGHSICCTSEDELYRWLAALMLAQHPEGFDPSEANSATASRATRRAPPLQAAATPTGGHVIPGSLPSEDSGSAHSTPDSNASRASNIKSSIFNRFRSRQNSKR